MFGRVKISSRNKNNSTGMTLVEVMVAVGITMIIVAPLVGTMYWGIKGAVNFSSANKAIQLAQELMEEIKQKKWDAKEPLDGGVTTAPYSAIGIDANRNEINPVGNDGSNGAKIGGPLPDPSRAWDDIDDFDGLVEHPPRDVNNAPIPGANKFTRSVSVRYVTINDNDPPQINDVTPIVGPATSEFKEITVTVTWDGMNSNAKPVTISTVMSNIKRY